MAQVPEQKLAALRQAGLPVDALHEHLQAQLGNLSDQEIQQLGAIKEKLNSGLPAALRAAASTVGGFVW
jgi:hypothetical protein